MMKRKTLVSLLVSLLLCIGLLPFNVLAAPAAPAGSWTDYAASSFASGSGTKEEPYVINSAEQLAKLAKDINSGIAGKEYTHNKEYFVLGNDVDLAAHRWIPIGSGTSISSFHAFTGYFDGNNKNITGLYVDESSELFSAGLFGHVSGIEIKNVIIKDGYVKTQANTNSNGNTVDGAGLLIGNASQGYGLTTTVSNCHVSGTVESDSALTGGLVGYNSYGTYEDCSTDVTINGYGQTGGFIGSEFSGTYKNCTAKGKISGTWSVGGFAGVLFYESKVSSCIADMNVTANDWNAGGFAGYIESNVSINNCIAYGDVHSTVKDWNPKVGGFAGTNDTSSISNSYAAGKVTSDAENYKAGGFIGCDNGGTTSSCNYDAKKNSQLTAVGNTNTAGTNDITAQDNILSTICTSYYGGHNLLKVEGEPATSIKDGFETYWKCEKCNTYFSDEKGINEIAAPVVIKATGVTKPTEDTKPTESNKPISISTLRVTLSGTVYTYNGKVKKPAVIIKNKAGKVISSANYTVKYASGRKNPGTYTVQITMKGSYTGKKTLRFSIRGKKMAAPKLTARSKAFKATWKKQKAITGYQLQYSTNAKFAKSKTKTVKITKNTQTSKLIKKLKARKKYYVRVRSYKTTKIGGKSYNAYSVWSKAKKVTIKK